MQSAQIKQARERLPRNYVRRPLASHLKLRTMKLASRGLPPLFPVGGGAGRSDPFGPFSSSSDYSLYGRVTPVGPAGERRIVPQQAVEKWLQQPAPSLLSLPRRARSLGRKPVFTPGVDGKSETRRLLEGFFNTLLRNLCTSQGCHSERCENPEKARHRDPFATAAFAQGDTIRLVRRVPMGGLRGVTFGANG